MSAKSATAEKNSTTKEATTRSPAHAAHTPESSSNAFDFSMAQQSAGNLAVQLLFRSGVLQAKLTVSQPGDTDEEEADRVAGCIMRMPDPASTEPCPAWSAGAQPCPECPEQPPSQVQRKANGTAGPHQPSVASHVIGNLGAGHPLDKSTRAFFDPRFGYDFSQVRVHTDDQAAQSARRMQARAFTTGQDVVFGAGEFAPHTTKGRALLAHELAHTIQQSMSSRANANHELEVSPPEQASELEVETTVNVVGGVSRSSVATQHSVPVQLHRVSKPVIQRAWYDVFVEGAEWVGGKIEAGAEATWEGAQWVGGKIYQGGRWVLNTAEDKLKAAWQCTKRVGSSLLAPISLDIFNPPARFCWRK